MKTIITDDIALLYKKYANIVQMLEMTYSKPSNNKTLVSSLPLTVLRHGIKIRPYLANCQIDLWQLLIDFDLKFGIQQIEIEDLIAFNCLNVGFLGTFILHNYYLFPLDKKNGNNSAETITIDYGTFAKNASSSTFKACCMALAEFGGKNIQFMNNYDSVKYFFRKIAELNRCKPHLIVDWIISDVDNFIAWTKYAKCEVYNFSSLIEKCILNNINCSKQKFRKAISIFKEKQHEQQITNMHMN